MQHRFGTRVFRPPRKRSSLLFVFSSTKLLQKKERLIDFLSSSFSQNFSLSSLKTLLFCTTTRQKTTFTFLSNFNRIFFFKKRSKKSERQFPHFHIHTSTPNKHERYSHVEEPDDPRPSSFSEHAIHLNDEEKNKRLFFLLLVLSYTPTVTL